MRCPKCGHENEDGTLFCDECDWRMDQPYRDTGSKADKALIYAGISIVLGLVGLVVYLVAKDLNIVGAVCGAVALYTGGFGITLSRHATDKRTVYMAMSGVGLLCGMVAFILCLTLLVL